jgi:DNA modification methylase
MAAMHPWISQTRAELVSQRPPGALDDEHFTESLAAAVIAEFTGPGDLVLDPFGGFGTVPKVAAALGRRAVAVELQPERAQYIRRRAPGAQVLVGDSRQLGSLIGGPVDLCLTSPPYMTINDHPENPLNAYNTDDGDYQRYLAEIGAIFGAVAGLLRPGGHAVVNVATVINGSVVTPLAWDMAARIARHLVLRQDVFLCWDEQPDGLAGDYCLVFAKPA